MTIFLKKIYKYNNKGRLINKNKMQAYCVKCKSKQEMRNEQEILMKGKGGKKRNAATGTCPVCGTKMFRILGVKKNI